MCHFHFDAHLIAKNGARYECDSGCAIPAPVRSDGTVCVRVCVWTIGQLQVRIDMPEFCSHSLTQPPCVEPVAFQYHTIMLCRASSE